ncbi:uncharacterized protein A4U43_C07F26580 [Asparagus officinalis]|uniref:Uncharacterized protein n=1 Tax=Asparagus officinalis TaxID=4686 RepID=A0A5P1EH14_ASPOF|nr:uncharacterized protein A4U43_C07F26580 [Asparagus officinalis]
MRGFLPPMLHFGCRRVKKGMQWSCRWELPRCHPAGSAGSQWPLPPLDGVVVGNKGGGAEGSGTSAEGAGGDTEVNQAAGIHD